MFEELLKLSNVRVCVFFSVGLINLSFKMLPTKYLFKSEKKKKEKRVKPRGIIDMHVLIKL